MNCLFKDFTGVLYFCHQDKKTGVPDFSGTPFFCGGTTRNRTGDEGFADLCLTAWLWCHLHSRRGMQEKEWSGKRDLNSRPPPWQGDALPLSYSRINGASEWARTTDTRIFSPLLYQLSYRGINGDPEGARTPDLQRDRLAY